MARSTHNDYPVCYNISTLDIIHWLHGLMEMYAILNLVDGFNSRQFSMG